MVVDIAAGYIANALLQNLGIPEIAKRLAGKAGEKDAKLKDIEKPKWLRKIGLWLDDHHVGTPEKVEKIINEHQEEILRELTEHKGELSDLGQQIFDVVNQLKVRIDNAQLTDEDKEFLAEVKKNFDPDEFEKRLEKILKRNVYVDSQKIHDELMIFFDNMDWDDKLDVIDSKLGLVLKNISEGIEDIKGRLDRIERSKRSKIRYLPEAPPDVSEFVDRETHLDDLRNTLAKKNTIVIQGIAGIGKTQLAAKLLQSIEDEYITFWKELRDVDTFDSVTRTFAGFLRKNDDPELAEYIEGATIDHDTVLNILLRSLENKNYVLFFDNYHVVENKEIHDIFKQFKDRLKGSTIVITTRNPPPFVQIDLDESNITEKGIEGFELEATKVYLEQMGVNVSEEQLTEINRRMGGHPLSLSMFVSVTKKGEREAGEILNKLPKKGRLERYLYNNIYERLNDDEQRVLEAISVFRTPVLSEACVYVAKGGNVKKTLIRLEEKLLVKEKGDLYYLHDLIRDFSYNLIDDPKEYHRPAGEYYAQLEKTPENILETTHHMIKDVGRVINEVIDYLLDTPTDAYTHFVVLNILAENKIQSLKFFDLIKRIYDTGSVDIKQLTIKSLVNNKELNRDKTIGIIEEIINKDENTDCTYFAICNLCEFTDIFPERVLGTLDKIVVDLKEKRYVYAILYLLQDSGFKHEGTISILKRIIFSDSAIFNLLHRRFAYDLLEDWGIALPEISKVDLKRFREMTVKEVIEFIDEYLSAERVELFINEFVLHFILRELYKIKPHVSSKFMKKCLETATMTNFEIFSEVLANPAYYNPEIINDFLAEKNDWIIRFTGFTALEFNINNEFKNVSAERHEETKKVSISTLKNLLKDSDPLMKEMANVAYNRTTKPKEIEKTKIVQKIKNKVIKKMLNLADLKKKQKYLEGGAEFTNQYQTLVFWLFYNALLPNTNPADTFGVLRAAGRDGVIEKNIVQFTYNEVKNNPCDAIEILNKFGIKYDDSLSKAPLKAAIQGIDMMGQKCPDKALKTYESLLSSIEGDASIVRDIKFILLGTGATGLLRNFGDQPEGPEKERIKSILERLRQDEDKEVGAFADIVLNGIQFREKIP
jgi:uncharacterized protein YutD